MSEEVCPVCAEPGGETICSDCLEFYHDECWKLAKGSCILGCEPPKEIIVRPSLSTQLSQASFSKAVRVLLYYPSQILISFAVGSVLCNAILWSAATILMEMGAFLSLPGVSFFGGIAALAVMAGKFCFTFCTLLACLAFLAGVFAEVSHMFFIEEPAKLLQRSRRLLDD